jgi:hypothetical protein
MGQMMEELAFGFQATNFPILTIIQNSFGTNPISLHCIPGGKLARL